MSILFLSSSGKLHETALSMKIGTKSTLNRHQFGTRLGLSRDHVAVQSPTQSDKTTFYKQVTEQVAVSNYKGYQDFAAEVGSRIKSHLAAQGGME